MGKKYQIITFYQFKRMNEVGELTAISQQLRERMEELGVFGTIILAE